MMAGEDPSFDLKCYVIIFYHFLNLQANLQAFCRKNQIFVSTTDYKHKSHRPGQFLYPPEPLHQNKRLNQMAIIAPFDLT